MTVKFQMASTLKLQKVTSECFDKKKSKITVDKSILQQTERHTDWNVKFENSLLNFRFIVFQSKFCIPNLSSLLNTGGPLCFAISSSEWTLLWVQWKVVQLRENIWIESSFYWFRKHYPRTNISTILIYFTETPDKFRKWD